MKKYLIVVLTMLTFLLSAGNVLADTVTDNSQNELVRPFTITDEYGNESIWLGWNNGISTYSLEESLPHWDNSKKGIQCNEYLLDTDYQSLGVKHILMNIVLNPCINYENGEYSFIEDSQVEYYKQLVQKLNSEGVTVSMVLLMNWDSREAVQQLIYSGAREANHPFYALNCEDEVGVNAWKTIFSSLVSTFSQSDCHIENWIFGNEVNLTGSSAYQYTGTDNLQTNVSVYTNGFYVFDQVLESIYPSAKTYLSLDHCWTSNDSGHTGKEFLDLFVKLLMQKNPNARWNLAWHPYAPNLNAVANTPSYNTLIWEDGPSITHSVDTPYVCGSNLEVLTDYVKNNWGSSHRIILSEQGYDARGGVDNQSAFLAYTYYAAEYNDMIDACIFRTYIDVPAEYGLQLGLLSGSADEMVESEDPEAYLAQHKRQSYDVFKYMDTDRAASYTQGCLQTIGASSWEEIVPGYAGPAAISGGNLTTTLNEDETCTVTLTDTVSTADCTANFAVWTTNDGQDDLQWYEAASDENGNFTYTFPLDNHKALGEFQIEAYAKTPLDKRIYLTKTSISVEKPYGGTATIEDYSEEAGTLKVRVQGIENSFGVKSVQVAVWCDSIGGQDDLKWYTAVEQADGSYLVDVSMSNHSYQSGTYYLDTYVYNYLGEAYGISRNTVTYAQKNIQASAKTSAQKEYLISIPGYEMPSTGKNVLAAVWSEVNGQDDLRWYTLQKSSGSYQVTVKPADHKSTGVYQVHAYLQVQDGSMQMIQKTNFTVTKASCDEVVVENLDNTAGTCEIIIKNVNAPSGVSKVLVPVWSQSDQSDIKWYEAAKASDGNYHVTMNLSNHKYYTGTYNIHVYVTDGNNIQQYVGKNTTDAVFESSETKGTVKASDSKGTQKEFKLTASGISMTGGCKVVYFAVWSEKNGQDDLHWYQATKNSNGNYTYTVNIADHKTTGLYNVHVYATNQANVQSFMSKTEFTVDSASCDEITVDTIANQSNKRLITVNGAYSPSGVSKVLVPIWSKSDQSDINWYEASNNNGVYTVTMDLSKHKYSYGTYQIHAYVTDGNGIQQFVGNTTTQISVQKPELTVTKSGSQGTQYAIQAADVSIAGGTTKVLFAIWSEENGQDDLQWNGGTYNLNSNTWNYVMNTNDYKHKGTFNVHAYAQTGTGEMIFLNSTTFTAE